MANNAMNSGPGIMKIATGNPSESATANPVPLGAVMAPLERP